MKKIKILAMLLIISASVFSQKKDSIVRLPTQRNIGESWEYDYVMTPPKTYTVSECYYIFVSGDSVRSIGGNKRVAGVRRLFSIIIKKDTATIEVKELPKLINDINYIKIGDTYFKKETK